MNILLAFYPNKRGIGYACIEMPQNLLDSGIINVYPFSSERILSRIRKYVEFFRPKIVVMRDVYPLGARGARTRRLTDSIREFAKEQGIPCFQYSRQQMKETFEQFNVKGKYNIAMKLIEWFPELSDRTPKMRKPWTSEDYHMAVFDAISLAVTHEYIGE